MRCDVITNTIEFVGQFDADGDEFFADEPVDGSRLLCLSDLVPKELHGQRGRWVIAFKFEAR
jgi:hypothetical protein